VRGQLSKNGADLNASSRDLDKVCANGVSISGMLVAPDIIVDQLCDTGQVDSVMPSARSPDFAKHGLLAGPETLFSPKS
jgi:hypothetical protein